MMITMPCLALVAAFTLTPASPTTGTDDPAIRSVADAITISASDLRDQTFPGTLPAPILDALRAYAPLASRSASAASSAAAQEPSSVFGPASLRVLVQTDPPVVLLTEADDAEAATVLDLLDEARSAWVRSLGGSPPVARRSPGAPLLVFHFTTAGRYDALLDLLADRHRYLRDWVPAARELSAFCLYQPRLMAVREDARASRDLNLHNLFVHMTSHLLTEQCYGSVPFWMLEGLALEVETDVLDSLLAFCRHEGFLDASRASAWRADVGRAWEGAGRQALEEIFRMRRDRFDRATSLRALGLVDALVARCPSGFASALGDAERVARVEDNVQLLDHHIAYDWDASAFRYLALMDRGLAGTPRAGRLASPTDPQASAPPAATRRSKSRRTSRRGGSR